MKKRFSVFTWLAALAVVVLTQGCREDAPEIGDPWSHIEGITATPWILTEVDLIDEGNPSRPRRSISRFFTEGESQMTLNLTEDGHFESVPGDGGQVFPLDGTWSFDLDEAPRRVTFVGDDETIVANLGRPVRIIDPELRLELVKKSCIVDGEVRAALGYRFTFVRQN